MARCGIHLPDRVTPAQQFPERKSAKPESHPSTSPYIALSNHPDSLPSIPPTGYAPPTEQLTHLRIGDQYQKVQSGSRPLASLKENGHERSEWPLSDFYFPQGSDLAEDSHGSSVKQVCKRSTTHVLPPPHPPGHDPAFLHRYVQRPTSHRYVNSIAHDFMPDITAQPRFHMGMETPPHPPLCSASHFHMGMDLHFLFYMGMDGL